MSWFGVLETFLTKRELELLVLLPSLVGKTYSKAADRYTTRKRILKKFKNAGIIKYDPGKPITLTQLGEALLG